MSVCHDRLSSMRDFFQEGRVPGGALPSVSSSRLCISWNLENDADGLIFRAETEFENNEEAGTWTNRGKEIEGNRWK